MSSVKRALVTSALAVAMVPSVLALAAYSEDLAGAHWKTSRAEVVVSVRSSAPASWQVNKALANWSASKHVEFRVESKRDRRTRKPGFQCGKRCDVMVAEGPLPERVRGDMTAWRNEHGHFDWADVRLASGREFSPEFRLAIACHELGHALGLEHREADANSCMRVWMDEGAPSTPDAQDMAKLAEIYGHTH